MTPIILLSLVVFLPTLGALVVALMIPKDNPDAAKTFSLAVTAVVFAMTVFMAIPGTSDSAGFELGVAKMQKTFSVPWIESFNIHYFMGTDGISFPLVLLTSFITMLAMWASWPITKHVKAYCVLFLLLETGVMGVFLALDFFLFYVFWEVMLLPMYFLIGVWGGPRREYAAIKFFLYTLFGGVLMLVAILMLYFNSDMRTLAKASDLYGNQNAAVKWADLHVPDSVQGQLGLFITESDDVNQRISFQRTDDVTAGKDPLGIHFENSGDELSVAVEKGESGSMIQVTWGAQAPTAAEVAEAVNGSDAAGLVTAKALGDGSAQVEADDVGSDSTATLPAFSPDLKIHTFNLLALTAMGQHTDLFNQEVLGARVQIWAFILLFIGFAIKVPAVPVHTWLPDAHVEAPTPISMILAGILLKLGGYGIIRICYPICPAAGFDLAWWVCGIGVLSMVYGAFAALAQRDFKRLVAYSSVSHMGYVLLGMGVVSLAAGSAAAGYDTHGWKLGMNGAMFQMIAHGISSAGMFFLVGVVYDRVHHRNLNEFGGLFAKMPVYGGVSIVIFFAGMGLPGLCGFIGEIYVTLSAWSFSYFLAIVTASVVIFTAGYILWTVQRVFLGPEYKGPHPEALTPMTVREKLIIAPLIAFAILFGVYPSAIWSYMTPSVDAVVDNNVAWKIRQDEAENAPEDPLVVSSQPGDQQPGEVLAKTGNEP
ncbi:MAG: NADH-quinone oxidoreductase subunit M [Pirellulales bacterium]|nr:NADH-quinone oxidoreductase subunit M [Pirellulales bacterium]